MHGELFCFIHDDGDRTRTPSHSKRSAYQLAHIKVLCVTPLLHKIYLICLKVYFVILSKHKLEILSCFNLSDFVFMLVA